MDDHHAARVQGPEVTLDTTTCVECGELAEVLWRDVLEGTDGPVEHAKVACVQRHWFLLPVARLDGSR